MLKRTPTFSSSAFFEAEEAEAEAEVEEGQVAGEGEAGR